MNSDGRGSLIFIVLSIVQFSGCLELSGAGGFRGCGGGQGSLGDCYR